jgi:phospholipase C
MSFVTRARVGWAAAAVFVLAGTACFGATAAASADSIDNSSNTATPIKHVVVMFNENISFDHYFGTYPNAANTDGTPFTAAPGTPIPNNYVSHPELLTDNPNPFNPVRLDESTALTCDQTHAYGTEQKAFDNGAMDMFNLTQGAGCTPSLLYGPDGIVMDYYDGNTVPAMWNLAQNYSMNDNNFGSTFGGSTPGALNLIAGNTHGVKSVDSITGAATPGAGGIAAADPVTGIGTATSNPEPYWDDCSDESRGDDDLLATMQGRNIGNLLNDKNVTWGWFQGGFRPTTSAADASNGYAVCGATSTITAENANVDISAYDTVTEPFQYFQSTANPHHLAPSSVDAVGHSFIPGTATADPANHDYDLTDFSDALANDSLPAVSFLKPSNAQTGHPGSSNPVDEQIHLVKYINEIEQSPAWKDTAIVLTYDDSDGWYDHVAPTVANGSADAGNSDICTGAPAPVGGYLDRCGPGPRLPLLVISPFAKQNYIDSTNTEQASIIKFIEDNWQTGRIGDSSFDERAGSIDNMFDFAHPQQRAIVLGDDGTVAKVLPVDVPVPGDGNGDGNGDGSGDGSTPAPTSSSTPDPTSTAVAAASGGTGGSLAATGLQLVFPLSGAAFLVAAGVVIWAVRRKSRTAA